MVTLMHTTRFAAFRIDIHHALNSLKRARRWCCWFASHAVGSLPQVRQWSAGRHAFRSQQRVSIQEVLCTGLF